jgi:hypothetical protein
MKFKTGCFLYAILFLTTSFAYADGLPVTPDKKHVQGSYTRIVLDNEQIKEVETRRTITLRPDQKAKLEKIAGGPLGDIIVYSSRYDFCTCYDAGVKAIWTQKGVLDFPHSGLVTQKQQREEEGNRTDEPQEREESADLIIVFDSAGEMYVDGKHMTLPEIVKQIDLLNRRQPKDKKKKMHRVVIFDPPPPISEEIDNKVLSLYHDIDGLCAIIDVDTQDGGIEQIGISL